jgi:hypothetical protein
MMSCSGDGLAPQALGGFVTLPNAPIGRLDAMSGQRITKL